MDFARSFKNAYILASERAKLANSMDFDDPSTSVSSRLSFYIERKSVVHSPDARPLECLGSIFGYLVGTYSTYCSTQAKLKKFDSLVEIMEAEAYGDFSVFDFID